MSNIQYIRGNIFASPVQTLVNTINCKGVMGAGIALEFKYRYPKMFESYQNLCEQGHIQIGKLWLYKKEANRKWVLNFPTKYDWRYESKMEYLEQGLQKFVDTYQDQGILSAAFPLLGADKGGLNPEQVREVMQNYLSKCNIPIEIYEYDPTAQDDLMADFYKFFAKTSPKILLTKFGIDTKLANKIRKILETTELVSLTQLTKICGIGEEAAAKCFKIAISLQSENNFVNNIAPTADLFSPVIPMPEIEPKNTAAITTEQEIQKLFSKIQAICMNENVNYKEILLKQAEQAK